MIINKLLIDRLQSLSEEQKKLGRLNLNSFNTNSVADEFSSSSTYNVGDLVTHESDLYQCTTAVTTAGDWNNSNWTKVNVVDAFKLAFATYGTTTYATIKSELNAGKIVFLNHNLTGGEVVILSTSGYKEVNGVGFIDFIGIQSGNVGDKDLVYRTRISSNNTWSEVTSGPIGGDLTESDLGNIIASIYNQSTTYTKGQYVIYNKRLYRCKSETSGQWDGTKWESTHSTDVFSGSAPGLVPVPATANQNASSFLSGMGDWNILTPVTNAEIDEMFVEGVLIGGREYKTVQIGDLLWITEDLDYLPESVTLVTTSWNYDDGKAYAKRLGEGKSLCYNGPAILAVNSNLPSGWRVPSITDMGSLIQIARDSSDGPSSLATEVGWDNPPGQGTNSLKMNIAPNGFWGSGGLEHGSQTTIARYGSTTTTFTNIGPMYSGMAIGLLAGMGNSIQCSTGNSFADNAMASPLRICKTVET